MNSYEEEILKSVLEGSGLNAQDRLSLLSIVENLRGEVEFWRHVGIGTNHDPRCQNFPSSNSKWICQRCELEALRSDLDEANDEIAEHMGLR